MNETEQLFFNAMNEIREKLGNIQTEISSIETKLENDFREIHGNGQPGLVQKHADLEKRVSTIETKLETHGGIAGRILAAAAWLITTAIAIYGAIRNSN